MGKEDLEEGGAWCLVDTHGHVEKEGKRAGGLLFQQCVRLSATTEAENWSQGHRWLSLALESIVTQNRGEHTLHEMNGQS